MLARGTSMLTEAQASGRAVAGITAYTLESIRAICAAAEQTGQPVVIQAGSSSFRSVGREPLGAAALAAAAAASVPIGVHLDHSTDPDEISACIALGHTSVMIDGSRLPFEDNVALTRSVVEGAHAAGVWVEAEVGGLAGDGGSPRLPPGWLIKRVMRAGHMRTISLRSWDVKSAPGSRRCAAPPAPVIWPLPQTRPPVSPRTYAT